jgi:hypothetical protein
MSSRKDQSRIRAAFRVVTRDLVEEVIDISRRENKADTPSREPRGMGRAAAASAFPGWADSMTVKSFINKLPKKEQAELAALMVLGREPLTLRARDVETAVDPASWTCNLGQYLASKGGLARYLQEGMRVVGL